MNKNKNKKAFSLAELLAALLISSLVLITVLGVFSQIQKSSAKILKRLDESVLPRQILQLITEDIEGTLTNTNNAKITFATKRDSNGYRMARLEIERTIYNKNKTFETIIWQSSYDLESDQQDLVLYRKHTGLGLEDRLLGEKIPIQDRELFIPVCEGLTCFEVQRRDGNGNLDDRWAAVSLPTNIIISLSFAEPVKSEQGNLKIPEMEKITKTIVIDRTKSFKFAIEKKEYDIDVTNLGDLSFTDPNEVLDMETLEQDTNNISLVNPDDENETQ